MSTKEDYDAKINEIMAIEDSEIKTPISIPVDAYVQETENLFHWCQDDQEALTGKGMSWDLVTDLPARSGALREAESVWNTKRFTRQDAEKKWAEDSPGAYDLRDELLHEFRFAFRNDPVLLRKVNDINEGDSHADMIQDLNDLSVLGKTNFDLLTAIGLDMTVLDTAADKANEMASLYAEVTGDRIEYNAAKKIRDKAFTYLKQAVDEIYRFGQYVFWRNDERRKGYRSNYLRRKRRKEEPPAPTDPQAVNEEVNEGSV